jgi:hypothetical protein
VVSLTTTVLRNHFNQGAVKQGGSLVRMVRRALEGKGDVMCCWSGEKGVLGRGAQHGLGWMRTEEVEKGTWYRGEGQAIDPCSGLSSGFDGVQPKLLAVAHKTPSVTLIIISPEPFT